MPPSRVFRNSLNNDYLRSPYARDSSFRSPNVSRVAPKTPGSIFSKVKQMFSPSTWLSENEGTMNDESDDSILSSLNSAAPSVHHTPKNPIDEFHRMQHPTFKDSPNARLADFFAKKGNAPLSEIELEGVKALLAKSNSVQTSPRTPRNERDQNDDNDNDRIEVLKPRETESAIKATPSFKATYNNTVSADQSFDNNTTNLTSARKRRVFDFSGFPSPYRTSRLKESSFMLDDSNESKPEISTETGLEEQIKEEKKMSNTASALLSFIENNESTEEKSKEGKKPKKIDYSNPYATISSSHRKSQKASASTSNTNRKLTPFEQLEQSLALAPAPEPQPAQPEISIINKYKPIKSSSLRESISLGDSTDQSVDGIEIDEPEVEDTKPATEEKKHEAAVPSSFSFKVPEVPQSTTSEKTDSEPPKPTFNAKPLFSFAPKPNPSAFTQSQELSIQMEQETVSQTTSQSNGFNHFPSSDFTFRFPNAESLGYTTSDLNEQKVADFKTYFIF